MEDGAHARYGEVRLEVLLRVPAEGRDAVADANAEPMERRSEPRGAVGDLGEARAPDAIALHGRDLARGVNRLAVTEDVGDRERVVLHRAEQHRRLLGGDRLS